MAEHVTIHYTLPIYCPDTLGNWNVLEKHTVNYVVAVENIFFFFTS